MYFHSKVTTIPSFFLKCLLEGFLLPFIQSLVHFCLSKTHQSRFFACITTGVKFRIHFFNSQGAKNYFCNSEIKVICNNGWMKSGYQIGINEKKTCSIAICNWDVGSCLQGECHAPQQCVSNNGWNGERMRPKHRP